MTQAMRAIAKTPRSETHLCRFIARADLQKIQLPHLPLEINNKELGMRPTLDI